MAEHGTTTRESGSDRHGQAAGPTDLLPGTLSARIRVLLPLPLHGAYDYAVPDDIDAPPAPGSFVSVPLGRRAVVGVVWDQDDPDDGTDIEPVPAEKLRPIDGILPAPALPKEIRQLVAWVAGYTVSPPGSVLRMAMSVPAALVPAKPQAAYRLADPMPDGLRLTAARRRVIDAALALPPLPAADLAREAGVGTTVIKGLAEAGALESLLLPADPPVPQPDPDLPGPSFSPDQLAAATALCADVRAAAATPGAPEGFQVTLLDGVTGSGKTEVYLDAVAEALRQGRQALVMLPEIALSAQWLERFQRRFGAPPAVWHSEIGQADRRRTWRGVAEGRVRVLVGARSALFLPFRDLGLIVVDEEHDGSFKQEDGVVYHARDMAVVRARLTGCPCVLVSATPSLETVVNVAQGRYESQVLPDRHAGASLPAVETVDLRRDAPPRGRWLSPALHEAVTETLAAGHQAMLFLNRRGYAPLTLCRSCGHRLRCPNCEAWLVQHRLAGRLQCHHCGFVRRPPPTCPECGAEDSLTACGPGVERLAEEAAAGFPDSRIAVISSDTVSGPGSAAELMARIAGREIDLVVGTQIVAKGHHFPDLTLVGVVDGDLGLDGGDLRAGERTYQLLAQVGGRAGRADKAGRVLIQTHQPDHPVMQALTSGDRDAFYAVEAEERERAGWPPFGRLAALVISARSPEIADAVCRDLARTAPHDGAPGLDGVRVLGPAPAPLSVLRGRHRRRFLLIAPRHLAIQKLLRRWLAAVKVPGGARVTVDVDPYSFL